MVKAIKSKSEDASLNNEERSMLDSSVNSDIEDNNVLNSEKAENENLILNVEKQKKFLLDILKDEDDIAKKEDVYPEEQVEQKVSLKNSKNKALTVEEMEELERKLKIKNFPIYKKLFKEELYGEIFKEIEKNYHEIQNDVVQKKYLKDAFRFVLHVENLDFLQENKKLIFLSKEIVKQFSGSNFLKKVGVIDNLDFYFQPLKCKVVFVDLLLNEDFDGAKFMLKFFEPNLKDFKKTVEMIQKNNNTKLLRFVCENMTNIHFNNGELLRKAVFMDSTAVEMLVNEFGFDVNDEDEINGGNVFQVSIEAGKSKIFETLVKNYSKELNVLKPMNINKLGELNLIKLIEKKCSVVKQYEFLNVVLDKTYNLNLTKPALKYISNIIFETEFMSKYHNTDIYEKFFQQKEFSHEEINFGQRYFLYGMLANIGEFLKADMAHNNANQLERYFNVMHSFLKHSKVEEIPPAINYHIVGAAVEIASFYDETLDILNLVLNKYQKYVNKPNPNGLLPIQQVAKNSTIYSVLIEHGAISIEEEEKNGFLSVFMKAFKKKKKPNRLLEHIQEIHEKTQEKVPQVFAKKKEQDITILFNTIKEDFMEINKKISHENVDLEVKSESENLYFKTIGLIKTLENKNGSHNSHYEEVHFLNQNFSNYLKKSVEKYVDLVEIYEKQTNKLTEEKMLNGRDLCLQQIKLLQKQVDIFIENILNNVTDEKIQGISVQKRFLEERFPNQTEEKIIKIKPN